MGSKARLPLAVLGIVASVCTLPTAAHRSPPAISSAVASGRIDDAQAVADLIAYNQENHVGLSIAGEGRIQRATGVISRWELPIPVYVDKSIHGANVDEAMQYWQTAAGLTFERRTKDNDPRIVVRAASAQELNVAIGLGMVYRTYANNRAQRGVVKLRTDFADCTANCALLYRHELGHAIGIFGHVKGGALMAAPQTGPDASQREITMLVQLYKLPHGTHIDPDGAWRVVK